MQVFATPCYELRITPDGTAAHRAFAVNVLGKVEGFRAAWPFRFHHLHNRWNYFAGFLDDHGVANSDVLAFDFVLVVQCGAADGASAYKHRFEHSNRCENSSTADLNDNVVEPGLDAFRCVLVSDRPARRFGGKPETLALREGVHFHDRAVGLISKLVADAVELVYRVQDFFE